MLIAGYIGAFLASLMLFLPMLSVFVRRLHDTNHSGWWYFIALIPIVGGIWLLVLCLPIVMKRINTDYQFIND